MRRSDIYTGLALAVFALASIFFVIPKEIGVSEEFGINPRVFPLTTMWLAVAVALLLVVVRLRELREDDDEPASMQGRNWLFIIVMSAFFAVSYAAFEILGFKIAAPATVALLMLVMGEFRHPVRLVLVSLLIPAVVYYAFETLFIVQLP